MWKTQKVARRPISVLRDEITWQQLNNVNVCPNQSLSRPVQDCTNCAELHSTSSYFRNQLVTLFYKCIRHNWRKLRKKEIQNLYFSPNTINVMKPKKIGWAWHVARMEERYVHTLLSPRNLAKRDKNLPAWDTKTCGLDWLHDYLEVRGSKRFRNAGTYTQIYTASYPRRPEVIKYHCLSTDISKSAALK